MAKANTKKSMMALALIDHENDPSLFMINGEYSATAIAEYLAHSYGSSRWLNDDRHWIWGLAVELCDEWDPYDPQGTDEWDEGEE